MLAAVMRKIYPIISLKAVYGQFASLDSFSDEGRRAAYLTQQFRLVDLIIDTTGRRR